MHNITTKTNKILTFQPQPQFNMKTNPKLTLPIKQLTIIKMNYKIDEIIHST